MNPSSDMYAKVLMGMEDIPLFKLQKNNRKVVERGQFKIAVINQDNLQKVYFININQNYFYIDEKSLFIKVEDEESVSYLFQNPQGGFSAFAFEKIQVFIHNLQEIFKNVSCLISYNQALGIPRLKLLIFQHCEAISKFSLMSQGKLLNCINYTGIFAYQSTKFLGTCISSCIDTVGTKIQQRIQKKDPYLISNETKLKWKQLKQGTGQLLKVGKDVGNAIINPIAEKGHQTYVNFNKKILNSSNSKLRFSINVGKSTINAIGQSMLALMSSTVLIFKTLGNQPIKIWKKKYGDNLPNQLFDQNQQKQIQLSEKELEINELGQNQKQVSTNKNEQIAIGQPLLESVSKANEQRNA